MKKLNHFIDLTNLEKAGQTFWTVASSSFVGLIDHRNFPLPANKVNEFTMGCDETENLLKDLTPSVFYWENVINTTTLGNATHQVFIPRKDICKNGLLLHIKVCRINNSFFC